MVAYVVFVREQTTNQAELDVYSSLAPATVTGHPATPRAVYGSFEVLEGPAIEGAVVLEFPSMSDAKA